MPSTLQTSAYTQTYTSFSGADIRAIFHQDLMINIQGLSYSVTREKAPIYSMGRPDPWSFSRGKMPILLLNFPQDGETVACNNAGNAALKPIGNFGERPSTDHNLNCAKQHDKDGEV